MKPVFVWQELPLDRPYYHPHQHIRRHSFYPTKNQDPPARPHTLSEDRRWSASIRDCKVRIVVDELLLPRRESPQAMCISKGPFGTPAFSVPPSIECADYGHVV
jgi:hypothetical protein